MNSNLDKYRAELAALVALGVEMLTDVGSRAKLRSDVSRGKATPGRESQMGKFETKYQRWYTEASAVMRQLIPERSSEFSMLYEADTKRKVVNGLNFSIQDWMRGIRAGVNYVTQEKDFDDFAAIVMRFSTQLDILRSAESRFESRLMDLEEIVRADFFDSELDKARELLKLGFERPSGVLAGVVLEEHLQNVCSKRAIRVTKKAPTISDLNDLLKNGGVIDTPVWRFIQRLGDIRNLCGHKKDREPTKEEVQELIEGTDKTIKTVH